MLKSDFCNWNDAHTVVKGRKTVSGTNNANNRNKKLIFKNNALFRSYISKTNNTFINNAEDLDIAMPSGIIKEIRSWFGKWFLDLTGKELLIERTLMRKCPFSIIPLIMYFQISFPTKP